MLPLPLLINSMLIHCNAPRVYAIPFPLHAPPLPFFSFFAKLCLRKSLQHLSIAELFFSLLFLRNSALSTLLYSVALQSTASPCDSAPLLISSVHYVSHPLHGYALPRFANPLLSISFPRLFSTALDLAFPFLCISNLGCSLAPLCVSDLSHSVPLLYIAVPFPCMDSRFIAWPNPALLFPSRYSSVSTAQTVRCRSAPVSSFSPGGA